MTAKKARDSLTSLVNSFPVADDMMDDDGARPLSFFDDNFIAPLASMEDLSILMTPMSTPGPTPGPSPKTRARWSHRMSSGAQFDLLPPINDDLILELPQQSNGRTLREDIPYPIPPPRKDPPNILLRKSLSNNRRNQQQCLCMQTTPQNPDNRRILKTIISEEEQEEAHPYQPLNTNNIGQLHDGSFFDPWRQKDHHHHHPSFQPWKPKDSERQRILDDSDYPFVRPRQVHFVQTSTPKSRPEKTKNSCKKVQASIPESSSLLDSTATTNGSRISPEFGSLIRANDGRIDPETIMAPPNDRLNLVYLTMVLHGIGSLLAWNVFMTAKESQPDGKSFVLVEYFVDFKLSKEYTSSDIPYGTYFMQFIGIAAQVPNVMVNWANIFMNIGGTLSSRIVWTLLIEALVFVATIILAMVDSSDWPGLFFYLTFLNVAILNMASGIYQNTIFGLAARLPFKYTGAVVLGTNLSGTIISLINIICIWLSPNPRTGAIYYFIVALFIVLACFNAYFALPLSRFFQYHNYLYTHKKKTVNVVHSVPHWAIFKQTFPQCFNIFIIYFVTLSVFPAVCASVQKSENDFIIPSAYFTAISCFLTLHVSSVLGNILPGICRQPGPRWLFIPVILRVLFMPFFLFCNYRPSGLERLWPILIYWDYAYWAGVALLGLSGGYFASLSMMHCPRSVEPEHASVAGMFGAASIITGIIVGLVFGQLMPLLVTHPVFAFETPEWWPKPL